MNLPIESYQPYLFAIAYNITGEIAEAEDLVQDAFADFLVKDTTTIQNVKTYLARMVANKAIDRLQELKKQRETYIGPWLPQPVMETTDPSLPTPEGVMSYEVLCALEQLNPIEKAVFVLREGFHLSYAHLADFCGTTEANCRQLLRRARQKVQRKPHAGVPDQQIQTVMQAFLQACVEDNTDELMRLLKADIILYSDGGGKVKAALNPIIGSPKVIKFFLGILRKNSDLDYGVTFITINRRPAALITVSGQPDSVLYFDLEEGLIKNIFAIRNPDKIS